MFSAILPIVRFYKNWLAEAEIKNKANAEEERIAEAEAKAKEKRKAEKAKAEMLPIMKMQANGQYQSCIRPLYTVLSPTGSMII